MGAKQMQLTRPIKRKIGINIFILLSALMLISCFFVAYGLADGHRDYKKRFGHEDQHRMSFAENENEGNETAGQIAAWLLMVANIPVALSLLVKLTTNKFVPLGDQIKDRLKRFNRFQKKHLMRLHYYINLGGLLVVIWHWVSSRCSSTAVPEFGFFMMILVISFGVLIKFKWCPKPFRKSIYKIHTQPILILSMGMVLTIGHLIVD
jgi:hypothetical protein